MEKLVAEVVDSPVEQVIRAVEALVDQPSADTWRCFDQRALGLKRSLEAGSLTLTVGEEEALTLALMAVVGVMSPADRAKIEGWH